jgi:membrane fusion protein (multidrug efflux system)
VTERIRAPAPAAFPACLVAALVLAGCGRGSAGASPQAAEGNLRKRELPSVRVAPVVVREMARVLETTSKLESEREIRVVPRVSGVVVSLAAEEGDIVEHGAVLALLDDVQETLAVKDAEVALREAENELDRLRLAEREAEARVQRLQLAFDQAARDYERNLRLFEGEKVASALSQSALEASKLARDNADADRVDASLARERAKLQLAAGETALERARITLDRARVTLTYTKVTAPFAGVVAERSVKVGDSVGPGTTAFVLTDVALLRCVFSRPQEELELFARVGSGNGDGKLTISATADAFPGRTFDGWIERVSPTIDAQSGQFRVTGRLECVQDGGRVRLLPGMLVRLRIVTDRHLEALVVPKRALEREGERRFLLAADRDPVTPGHASVRRVEVVEGFAQGEWIEVLPRAGQALAAGEAVIVVGGRDLAPGDVVTVDEERPAEGTLDQGTPVEGVAEAK